MIIKEPQKTVSILQSGYMPYLGFFELMARCDIFVIYDDVQYDKNSWRNRNRVRSPQGYVWLTVPVMTKGKMGQALNEVLIDNKTNWCKKHMQTLKQCYSKARYFIDLLPFMAEQYSKEWEYLTELNQIFIDFFHKQLGLKTEIIRSSELKAKGHKTERIIFICKELGADGYISTNGAKPYLEEDLFEKHQIALIYQDYDPPEYIQLYAGFISHLSVIDVLFNYGPDSLDLILSTSRCRFNEPGKYRGLKTGV